MSYKLVNPWLLGHYRKYPRWSIVPPSSLLSVTSQKPWVNLYMYTCLEELCFLDILSGFHTGLFCWRGTFSEVQISLPLTPKKFVLLAPILCSNHVLQSGKFSSWKNFGRSPSTPKIKLAKYFLLHINGISLYCRVVIATKITVVVVNRGVARYSNKFCSPDRHVQSDGLYSPNRC